MSGAQPPKVRDKINRLLGRSQSDEELVREQIDGEANEETIQEIAEEVREERQEIQEDVEEKTDLPFSDFIGNGEMQPFESSDVTMRELAQSIDSLEEAQKELAGKAATYEKQYQNLVDEADPDSYTEEQIIATRLQKNRVFFETMLELLDDVSEMLKETITFIQTGISENPEETVGYGTVLSGEDREEIAGEINEKEYQNGIGVNSRDMLNTGASGGIEQDIKTLRESDGGMDPVERDGTLDDIARSVFDDEDEEDGDENDGSLPGEDGPF